MEKYHVIRTLGETIINPVYEKNRFSFATITPDKHINTIFGLRKSIQDDVLDFLLSTSTMVEQLGLGYDSVMKLDLATYRNIKFKLKDRQAKIKAIDDEKGDK